MARILAIAGAGALGTTARYLVALGAARWLGATFPFGTLAVNVVGSFLIALFAAYAKGSGALSEATLAVLTTGFVGGFTTYSAFNEEALRLASSGQGRTAALYIAATLVLCILAGIAGHAAGRSLA